MTKLLIVKMESKLFRKSALLSVCAVVLGLIITAVVCQSYRERTAFLLLMLFFPVQIFGVSAAVLSLLPIGKKLGIGQAFAIQNQDWRQNGIFLARSVLIWLPVTYILAWVSEKICGFIGIPIIPQDFADVLPGDSWLYVGTLCFFAGIMAPISEELLFRHIFYRAIDSYWSKGAVILTSVLFAVIHGCPQLVISLFILAMVLQKMYFRGGLLLCIAMHVLFNLCSIIEIIIKAVQS